MLTLERVEPDWALLDARPDRLVFQTREWVEFVARTQGGTPVVATVRDGASTVGWFTGVLVKRLGVRILGSPFRGWTTHYMGFSLDDGVPRGEAARGLPSFARRELGCLHVELKDRDLDELDWDREPTLTFELALDRGEDELFAAMTSACRRAIRKSEKERVSVEEAAPDGFAEEYYAQLLEVFGRQGLRPPYGVERVRALVETVPRERLLLVRARDGEGRSIATGIFPGHNGVAYFWGGASRRDALPLRPNEAVFWSAMRAWRLRGARVLDLGGGGEYKRKYGVTELRVPWFRRSLVPGLGTARVLAERVAARGRR